MRFLLCLPLVALALVGPGHTALADGCPAAPDHGEALAELLRQVQSAKTEAEGQAISNRMWELWADAPDEPAQALLDQGMRARRVFDFVTALDRFDKLVDYCPHYAEGYNQRAFVNFLRRDFETALVDLDRALAINPLHVAALSGKGLTLLGLGRNAEAQEALRAAVALNPWLSERSLIAEPPGEEL